MDMPVVQARMLARALALEDRDRLLALAAAFRAAQAEEKDWKRWVKEVSG